MTIHKYRKLTSMALVWFPIVNIHCNFPRKQYHFLVRRTRIVLQLFKRIWKQCLKHITMVHNTNIQNKFVWVYVHRRMCKYSCSLKVNLYRVDSFLLPDTLSAIALLLYSGMCVVFYYRMAQLFLRLFVHLSTRVIWQQQINLWMIWHLSNNSVLIAQQNVNWLRSTCNCRRYW
jgi:hypothetical protein